MTGLAAAASSIERDLTGFKLRFPWVSADLQTLRNTLVKPRLDLSPWPCEPITLRFPDNGDETQCFVHAPQGNEALKGQTVALLHGLGGDASGTAIAYLARHLLSNGYRVVRVNLRAAPMVYHLASGIGHAGKSEDLAAILKGLDAALGTQRWIAIGISLGGNMLARALGDGSFTDIDMGAAMTICAPLDMKAASDRILAPRNRVYARYLLRDLQNAVLKTGMAQDWKLRARSAQTVYEFDDRVTAPYHGFGTAERYYAAASGGPHLEGVTVPTLVLHAADDPWIPSESYASFEPTRASKAQMVIVPKGGHVGFHDAGDDNPAYCRAALKWFTAVAN